MSAETRLLSLGELMDAAVRLARRSFAAVYPGIALPLAAAAGVMVVLQISFFRSFFPGVARMAADPIARVLDTRPGFGPVPGLHTSGVD